MTSCFITAGMLLISVGTLRPWTEQTERGKKKFWPSVMINKYITGYNSGEWRLTLTEHHDLHTTAKSPLLNKSQLLFVFSPLNDNFLKSKCRMEKEKKTKTIKDRELQTLLICCPEALWFWQNSILFLWSPGNWGEPVRAASAAAGQGSCATGNAQIPLKFFCIRMRLPSG